MEQHRTNKLIIIALVALAVIVLGVSLLFSRGSGVSINLVVAPTDSKVTLDGQPVSIGKIKLTPGAHTLRATRQYFADAEKKVDTKDLEDGATIYLLPEPNTEQAEAYMLAHPDQQSIRERGVAKEVSQTQDMLAEKYPFLSDLPYETLDYTIDYSVDKQKNVTLEVTLKPTASPENEADYKAELQQYKQEAIDYFNAHNIKLTGVRVVYIPDPEKL